MSLKEDDEEGEEAEEGEESETGLPHPESGEIVVDVQQVNIERPDNCQHPDNLPDTSGQIIPGVYRSEGISQSSENNVETVRIETTHGEYFVEINVPDNLLCQICAGLMISPAFGCDSQNHMYCRGCLDQIKSNQCPECRKPRPDNLWFISECDQSAIHKLSAVPGKKGAFRYCESSEQALPRIAGFLPFVP